MYPSTFAVLEFEHPASTRPDPIPRSRPRRRNRILRVIAGVLATSAVMTPVATAAPAEQLFQPTPSTAPESNGARESAPATSFVSSSDEFDWTDAGIGAAAVLLLGGIAATGAVTLGRASTRRQSIG
jgi:hypothetical protein